MRNFGSCSTGPASSQAKPVFEGISGRTGAFAFAINHKGYVGGGQRDGLIVGDLWEYNTQNDTWTLKISNAADFFNASTFVINNKGYVVGGQTNCGGICYTSELSEYDPSTNSWIQKASHPGPARSQGIGFAINGKGYYGSGRNSSTILRDFYQYDPIQNSWLPEAVIGWGEFDWEKVFTYGAGSFVYNNKGYIVGGKDNVVIASYDPLTEEWDKEADWGTSPIDNSGAIVLLICDRFYFGFGQASSNVIAEHSLTLPKINNHFQTTSITNFDYDDRRVDAVGFTTGADIYFGLGNGPFGNPNHREMWKLGYNVEISGADKVCEGQPETFTLTNYDDSMMSGASWSVGSLLEIDGPSIGESIIVNTKGVHPVGNTEINVELCEGNYIPQKEIRVGHPDDVIGPLSGPSSVAKGSFPVGYSVPSQSQADGTFDWRAPRGFLTSSGGDGYSYVNYWVQDNPRTSSGYVQVWKTNACGNGGAQIKWVTVTSGGCNPCPIVQLSPNPSSTSLNISYLDRETNEPLGADEFEEERQYLMTDHLGNIVLSYISDKTHQEIDVRGFKKGIYFLTITHGNLGKDQITVQIDK